MLRFIKRGCLGHSSSARREGSTNVDDCRWFQKLFKNSALITFPNDLTEWISLFEKLELTIKRHMYSAQSTLFEATFPTDNRE